MELGPGSSSGGTVAASGVVEKKEDGYKNRRLKNFFGAENETAAKVIAEKGGGDSSAKLELRLELDPEIAAKVQPEGGSCLSYKLQVERVRPIPTKPAIPEPLPTGRRSFQFISGRASNPDPDITIASAISPELGRKNKSSRNIRGDDDEESDDDKPERTERFDSLPNLASSKEESRPSSDAIDSALRMSGKGLQMTVRHSFRKPNDVATVNASKKVFARDDLEVELLKNLSRKILSTRGEEALKFGYSRHPWERADISLKESSSSAFSARPKLDKKSSILAESKQFDIDEDEEEKIPKATP